MELATAANLTTLRDWKIRENARRAAVMSGIGGSVLDAVDRADQVPLRIPDPRDEGVRRRQISPMY